MKEVMWFRKVFIAEGKYIIEETINGKDYNVNTKEYVYDEENRRIQMTVRSALVTKSDQGEIVDKSESWEVCTVVLFMHINKIRD